MRFYVISDNTDTLTGFRLAGIEGVKILDPAEIAPAVQHAINEPDIGVLLITEKLATQVPDLMFDLKIKRQKTLVVEIPDRHGTGRTPDSITRYIRDAIGIKV